MVAPMSRRRCEEPRRASAPRGPRRPCRLCSTFRASTVSTSAGSTRGQSSSPASGRRRRRSITMAASTDGRCSRATERSPCCQRDAHEARRVNVPQLVATRRFELKGCRFQLGACRFQLGACRSQLRACRFQLRACRSQLRACRSQLRACRFQLRACRFQLRACRSQLRACRFQLRACRSQLRACRSQLSREPDFHPENRNGRVSAIGSRSRK
jgi:hypothetical protein